MSEETDSEPDEVEEKLENELCPQCMTGNQPGTTFCSECGAPLSSYAATGPFECLFAEGHVYRRAAEQPRRFIVVLGMWVIFGGSALLGAATLALGWSEGGLPGIFLGIAMVVFSVVLLGKTTKNYCKRPRTTSEDTD